MLVIHLGGASSRHVTLLLQCFLLLNIPSSTSLNHRPTKPAFVGVRSHRHHWRQPPSEHHHHGTTPTAAGCRHQRQRRLEDICTASRMMKWRMQPQLHETACSHHQRVVHPPPPPDSSPQQQPQPQHDDDDVLGFRTLYPPSRAYRNGTIQVDSIHTLYYEEHGRLWNVDDDNNNEKGEEEDNSTTLLSTEPGTTSSKTLLHALFLHGGPGAGCSPRHAQFFDPSRYHIVLFDQRGSGHSVPRGDVRHNTLHDVVEDCETLRRQLNISQWHVMLGGSWGSTVAIAYAQQYPMVIQTMVLRGVCLLRPCEVNWLFGSSSGNMAMRLPQAWNDFCQAVGVVTTTLTSSSSTITDDTSQDDDITVEVVEQDPREALYAYYDRLLGDNPILRWKAARSWMTWEQAVASSASLSNSIVRSMEEDTAQLQHNKEQNQQHSSPPLVLVSSTLSSAALDGTDDSSSSSSLWSYQGLSGQLISNPSLLEQLEPPEHAVERLRQGLSCLPEDGGGTVPIFTPRPIRPVLDDLSERNITLSLEESEALSSFLPVQSMLTCYFSVNERYVLNNTPLLHATRMTRLLQYYAQQQQQPPLDEHHHGIMKVIAIHGGQDCICPLDNALELLRAWPNNNMELRVPLQAGHSMYDPAVTHEIIQATDRLANVSDAQS